VIHLYMAGGASHLETFDYRPKLGEMHGQPMPESFTKGQPIAQLQGAKLTCYAPQVQFRRYGKNGVEMSEHFPKLGAVSDEVCVVRSLVTEQINHDPAHTFMNTGTSISGRPSMGSWLWYGLGADCDNLPGFVVLTSNGRGGQNQPIANRQWSSGFIPFEVSGVHFRSQGEPVLYLGSPSGVNAGRQRDVNRFRGRAEQASPGFGGRSRDRDADQSVRDGVQDADERPGAHESLRRERGDAEALRHQGRGRLLRRQLPAPPRRLAERGVRFIQLYHRDWDHHGNLKNDIKLKSEEVDGPGGGPDHRLKRAACWRTR
jgi:hypothetical protein